MARNTFFFGFGLAVALFAGWVAFPRVLYVQKHQPVDFLHKTHAEKSGVADCASPEKRPVMLSNFSPYFSWPLAAYWIFAPPIAAMPSGPYCSPSIPAAWPNCLVSAS